MSIFTPVAALRALEADLKKYVEARDMLFVKDSFRVIVTEVRPGHYIKVSLIHCLLKPSRDLASSRSHWLQVYRKHG